jgi:uncharacterized protein YfaS (alpha-2-macroglobulin family)
VVEWDVAVPENAGEALRWEVEVREKGAAESDRMKINQRVVPAVPVRTFQATVAQVEKDFTLSLERPKDALPGGGVHVAVRPNMAKGLSAVSDYMKAYPYGCMEQRVSIAVALRDGKLWKAVMAQLPAHLDSDGLVKYFPVMYYGNETITAYLLSIAHEAGWEIPTALRQRMQTGLQHFVAGVISRGSPLPTADLAIRKLSAMEALSRHGKFDPKLLNSISIEPNLWPTSALIDWLNILRNGSNVPRRDERLQEAQQIIRSRLNFQGTVLRFSTEGTDCLWWLMISTDVNSVRAVLALLPFEKWKEDMPRLAQGAVARQKRGKWDLTVANAWGVLALEKFSKAFESVPVSGTTRQSLENQIRLVNWKDSPQGKVNTFPWPAQKETLSISHAGDGKPWATVQSLAAIPLKEPFSSGYHIKKTVHPVQQKDPQAWSRGDILRIRLDLEAQADQTWVVVTDPVPAGSTILGSGLGRDSELLTKGEKWEGRVRPAYEERSFEAFRAYYEYVPKGKWAAEYTVRLNQSGVFHLPPTGLEALYFPEMRGEIPNPDWEVHP